MHTELSSSKDLDSNVPDYSASLLFGSHSIIESEYLHQHQHQSEDFVNFHESKGKRKIKT